MEIQDNKTETLTWSITSEEKRARTQNFITQAILPLLAIGVTVTTYGSVDFEFFELLYVDFVRAFYPALYVVSAILIFLLLSYVVNKSYPYPISSYACDSSGVTISKGRQKKKFSWNEFDYFYNYSERGKASYADNKQNKKNKLMGYEVLDVKRLLLGDVFYLKKKKKGLISRLYKDFVVVYGEPDNSLKVKTFLSCYLIEKKMDWSSDMGLVFFEYK